MKRREGAKRGEEAIREEVTRAKRGQQKRIGGVETSEERRRENKGEKKN